MSMERAKFKERMKALKAYKDKTGKGYWDWKVQAFDGGGGVEEEPVEDNTVVLPIESPTLPQSHDPYYTQWQANWLNHRRKQLHDNLLNSNRFPTIWYSKKPNQDNIDIRDQKYDKHERGGNLFKYLYWALKGYTPDRIAVNQEFYRQLNNAATAPEITLDDYDWDTAGVYVRPNNWNGTGHYVAYVKNTELTHKIHERTHASNADPQEDAIQKIIGEDNSRETPYLKRPTEVYSRLMQYRHDQKLDPKQVITNEYLNEHRDLLEEYDLNIFTDEQLLDIFNDVAAANIKSDDNYIFAAKYGGVVPAYTDGTDGDDDPRAQIINRANEVASNYDNAKDFDLSSVEYGLRKLAKNLFGRGGISNCTLSATGWIDPNNQYMSARNIFNNPNSGYVEIDKEYALPGDLLISKNPEKDSYHTMLVEGFNNNEPLLRYSRGGHDTEENLVKGRPLTEYHRLDNEQGGNHTEDHYFRYMLPNEFWLPEITITAPRKIKK